MHLPDSLFASTDSEQLRSFVKNLLDTVERQRVQIEQLVEENEQLRAEIRHLKKHKGKPKLRANVPDKGDDQEDNPSNTEGPGQSAGKSDGSPPPKSKRPRSQEAGETAAPPITVDREEVCSIAEPGENWRFKCYIDFFHTELDLRFVTTRYRREYYTTPQGGVSAPLPEHVKSRFGDNLKTHLLDFYHSCSTTQPLLLSWLHDHGCSMSEGSLNNILTEGHDIFHQEKEELLEIGLTCSDYLQVDDTGARHQGKNGYCLFVGNPYFSYFHSSDSKSRINFLGCLQGQQRLYLLNDVAIDYMKQLDVSKKWVTALSVCDEKSFSTEENWGNFLDGIGCTAPEQRRWATEGALKAALMTNRCFENLIIHSDGARQFDTVFQHSLCWYHAGRNIDKLIPGDDLERAARDSVQDEYWCLYDDIEAYQKKPTDKEKHKLYQDFDRWVRQRVDYPALQVELGKLMVVREDLLLVLEYPWLPLHNNLSERQIREYVKRRKVSGGTRSELGRKCRDTFASLKKTCKQHGLSFANYLKDRLTGTNQIPRLGQLILEASGCQKTAAANGF